MLLRRLIQYILEIHLLTIKSKVGRPSKYSEHLSELICMRVATHPIGLPKLCKMYDDMPSEETIRLWCWRYPEFFGKYAQAKLKQVELLAEECLHIADNACEDTKIDVNGNEVFNSEYVARSRLRIDTRKWLASKLLPKQYGDRLVLEQKTEENDKLREELLQLRKELDENNKKDF